METTTAPGAALPRRTVLALATMGLAVFLIAAALGFLALATALLVVRRRRFPPA